MGRVLNHGIKLEYNDYIDLVGEYVAEGTTRFDWVSSISDPEKLKNYRYRPMLNKPNLLTMEEAKKLCPRKLVYVEELSFDKRNRAFHERLTENEEHKNILYHVGHSLTRLGYKIYPGGVGVPNIYEMADMLAIKENNYFLIEALTSSSINKYKAYENKKGLIDSGVPICFIGDLPDTFVKSLPSTSFAIKDSRSAFTLRSELTKFYWSDCNSPPVFVIKNLNKGRKKKKYSIDIVGIIKPEDCSDFWLSALYSSYLLAKKQKMPDMLEPIHRHNTPDIYPRYLPGKWNSKKSTYFNFIGTGQFKGVHIKLKLGLYPISLELEGENALDALISTLNLLSVCVDVN